MSRTGAIYSSGCTCMLDDCMCCSLQIVKVEILKSQLATRHTIENEFRAEFPESLTCCLLQFAK